VVGRGRIGGWSWEVVREREFGGGGQSRRRHGKTYALCVGNVAEVEVPYYTADRQFQFQIQRRRVREAFK